MSSRDSKSKLDSVGTLGSRTKNGVYYELGFVGKTVSDVRGGPEGFAGTETSSIDPGQVRRTDHFAVKSDRGGAFEGRIWSDVIGLLMYAGDEFFTFCDDYACCVLF